MRRLIVLAIPLLVALSAYVLLPLPGNSRPLSERIEDRRKKVDSADRRAGVLTSQVSRDSGRVRAAAARLAGTQRRLRGAQREVGRQRDRLARVQRKAAATRERLDRLRTRLRKSQRTLSTRLVELYKSDQPDKLTVILESDGFEDLLERTEFMERIARQDKLAVDSVRRDKRAVARAADRYGRLEDDAQRTTAAVTKTRDGIARDRERAARTTDDLRRARDRHRATLRKVQGIRGRAREDLAGLERQQAAIRRRLQAKASSAPSSPPADSGTPSSGGGSGRLTWPVQATVTSPFGGRWGRLHAGLDLAVSEGTPLRAAGDGTVALAAYTGGYGNYTCIQHSGGLSSCYAHQSRLGTTAGARVKADQVIGYSGNTGNSTGPHLHFEVRSNGSPVDPLPYL